MIRTLMISNMCLVTLWGCGRPGVAAPPSLHQLRGLVRWANGAPVGGGVVIATDLKTTNEIGVAQLTSDGRFVLDIPVPQVALTATTTQGYAFVPKVDVGRDGLEMRLDMNCAPLRGQVDLDGPPPPRLDPLRIGRLGKGVGDTFGASIDAERRFILCLTPAEYFVSLPPDFATRTILTTIPASEPLHVHATTNKHAETPPSEPLRITPQSRDQFVSRVSRSLRVLGLGESNHGTTEFTEERTELAIALADQQHFTVVMIEAGYGEVLPLEAYIHGAAIDIDTAIADLGYWIWNTRTFRKTLDKIRDHNRTTSPERTISIVGIDVQTTAGAIDALTAEGAHLSQQDAEIISRLRVDKGAAWHDFTQDQRRSTRAVLEKLASAQNGDGLMSGVNRQALSARSLLLRLELLDAEGFWNRTRARDRGMAKMVEEILRRQPDLRATLWAHLAHLAREAVVGAPTLGSYLAAALRDGYRAFALLAYAGSARGRDIKRELGVVAHPLPTAPSYALEGALVRSAQDAGPDITYWMFEDAARRVTWLRELRWIRSFGATYPGDQKSFELYDLRAIDGALLFRTVTPSEPLTASASSP